MSHQPHESHSHGVESLKDLTAQERRGLEDLIRGIFFQVEAVEIIQREGPDCDAIVDVASAKLRPSTRRAGETTRTVHQTVAYFTRPKLKTPAFTAGPMRGMIGGATRKMLGFVGVPTVNLQAYLDFNREFTVMSFQPGATQRLFTQPVVDAIFRHSEFTVTSGPGGIAVYRRGQTVLPSGRQAFYTSAREIADRIFESAAALPAEAMTRGQQSLQTIQTMGGWLGHQLKAWLVTTQEVDDFLAQAPPRVVPRGIRKCAYGASGTFMVMGTILLFISTVLACILVQLPRIEGPPWWPYALMALLLMGAVVFFFFAGQYRWRRRRILRDGICEQAEVVRVRDTGFYHNEDRQHYVTFETASGRVVVRLGSGPASLARTLQERGETVRLLVDPQNRSRALWIEGWAMDAYE